MERGVVRMRDETVEAVYDRLEESEALRHILLERCHATLFNGTARYKDRTAFISGSRVFDALFETVSQVF